MEWVAIAAVVVVCGLLTREGIKSRGSNSSFKTLADESPSALVVFDETTVLYANRRVVDLVGRDGRDESVIGRPVAEVLDEPTSELARRVIAEAYQTSEPVKVRNTNIGGRNGTVVPCDVVVLPIDYEGRRAVQCSFTPVDEKNRALRALHETEERFRRLFEELPVPMYRTRLDGTIVHANGALAKLLEVDDPEELIGTNARDFYLEPGDREQAASLQLQDGVLEDYISGLRTVTGGEIWVRDSSHTVVDNDGEIFEGALIDVTTEQRYNRELRRRATQQQALAAIAHGGLRQGDVGRVIAEAAEQVCSVMQAGCVAIARRHEAGDFVVTSAAFGVDSVRDRERLLGRVQEHSVLIPQSGEPVVLEAQGELDGVKATITGSEDVFGTLTVVGIGTNPSDQDLDFIHATADILGSAISRSRARGRLSQLMRSKDEFVASVSHELRTPLTVVAGLALELELGWKEFSPGELAEFISLIADQSREMGDLIEDLLVAARADIGKVPVYAETVDLRACVDQVVAACSLADRARIHVSGVGVKGHADPVRCRQVIRNLLTNAIRYGGSRIHVSLTAGDEAARLTVFDDGAGVAEESRDKIFTAYERAHDGDVGVPGSVGLGLTVSQTLTELMGGSISYHYDGGSHFEVLLPLAAEPATSI